LRPFLDLGLAVIVRESCRTRRQDEESSGHRAGPQRVTDERVTGHPNSVMVGAARGPVNADVRCIGRGSQERDG
jgi:hypothetical protein